MSRHAYVVTKGGIWGVCTQ